MKEICFSFILNQQENESHQFNSVLFYLFFSSKKEDLYKLKELEKQITNVQLVKIFDLCFSILNPILEGQKNLFFETALFQKNPLFFGYATLSQEELNTLAEEFINKFSEKNPEEVTKTILSLRNHQCTKILSNHNKIGIHVINLNLGKIWAEFCPYDNESFVISVKNPNNYHLWHHDCSSTLGFVVLDYDTLFSNQNKQSFLWQDFFEENLQHDINISMNIIFFQINGLKNTNKLQKAEEQIIENISSVLKVLGKNSQQERDAFIDKIYTLCISTGTSPQFMRGIYNLVPFSCTSWVFIAIALTAPKLDIQTLNYAILRELNSIREALLNENLDKDEYILEVTTRFQSIIVGADKFHVQVTQPTLTALKEIANLIQSILDTLEESNEEKEEDFGSGTNWNGHAVIDKPILRWNAILQVCLNSFLAKDEIAFYEKILCEGIRAAPHVEKRWVVRALVRIDSDDAIKTILYQALHHIDTDFVERTAYELFSSHNPRSKQALIRLIAKNNLSDKIKIAIIEHMKNFATQEIQSELKDLMTVRLPEKIERCVHNALIEISKKIETIVEEENREHKFTSHEIDLVIKSFVHNVPLLSVDSRSALRTAEMIFIQSKDWGKEAVDLSPIVNMYCKSVELVLRDTFEPFTDAIMRKGELSKKLDTLGYAKIIQDKMQNFEDFIADLPIVNTIPYFSKFKLRKMLRAICLYRPGKRFTLDGPKAFALFLLVTARKSCPYSMSKIFDLYFFTDMELFDFVKQVHSLQDSRNRAVHEGLTWEAREEIDNMRKQSYSIIDTCLKINRNLNQKTKHVDAMEAV